MSKRGHWIVFGANDKPNKGMIAVKRGTGYDVHILEIDNDNTGVSYGEKFDTENIVGEYTTLMFAKKESLKAFIDGLMRILEDWNES